MARPDVVEIVTASSSCRHMVAMPLDSVSPYPVTTTSKPSSDFIRSTSSTGTAAAPVTARRSVCILARSRSGWLRNVW